MSAHELIARSKGVVCMRLSSEDWGSDDIRLNVEEDNLSAKLFYQRLGFAGVPGDRPSLAEWLHVTNSTSIGTRAFGSETMQALQRPPPQ